MQALELCATEGLNRHTLKAHDPPQPGRGAGRRAQAARRRHQAVPAGAGDRPQHQGRPSGCPTPRSSGVRRRRPGDGRRAARRAGRRRPRRRRPRPRRRPPTPAAAPGRAARAGHGHRPQPGHRRAAPARTCRSRRAVDERSRFDRVVLAYRPEGASDFLARDMERGRRRRVRRPHPRARHPRRQRSPTTSRRAAAAARRWPATARPTSRTSSPWRAAPTARRGGPGGQRRRARRGAGPAGRRRPRVLAVAGHRRRRRLGQGQPRGEPQLPGRDDQARYAAVRVGSIAAGQAAALRARDRLLRLARSCCCRCRAGCSSPPAPPRCATTAASRPASASRPPARSRCWARPPGSCGERETLPPVRLAAGRAAATSATWSTSASRPRRTAVPSGNQACIDTVAGGGLLVGPAAGVHLRPDQARCSSPAAVNALLGLPKTAFNFDLNLGLGYRL